MPAAPRRQPLWSEHPPADVLIAVGSASLFLLVCAIALKASAAQPPAAPAMTEQLPGGNAPDEGDPGEPHDSWRRRSAVQALENAATDVCRSFANATSTTPGLSPAPMSR